MSVKRVFAVGGILVLACAGWGILGTATAVRSVNFGERLGSEVEGLWGAPLVQKAPSLAVQIAGSDRVRWIMPSKSDINVGLTTDYRKKGLIWYPTYVCTFKGRYRMTNQEEVAQKVRLHFDFPTPDGTYREFAVTLDERPLQASVKTTAGIDEIIALAPGESKEFFVAYKTRGLEEWRYQVDHNVGRVQDFKLTVRTGFPDIDYPDGTLSAMSAEPSKEGMDLQWSAKDLITNQDMGVIIPEKLNPGPLTSRITFFAPVCLVFFFILVATINILYRVDIHPMHYLFVAAGFFAFHLLLAYMAGLVHIHVAFAISAVTSVALVTSYLSAALGRTFPWRIAVAGQIFFLVLFSYSFFLKGLTGLTVAIGSVVTLAVLMRVTAHIDWNQVFARQDLGSGKKRVAEVSPPLG